MALSLWPLSLPQAALRTSFQTQAQDGRWVFNPDGGPALIRPAGALGKLVTLEFRMTTAQVDVLRTFYRVTLRQGALAFRYTGPGGGIPSGAEVRFAPGSQAPYSITPMGPDAWRVLLCWEVLP